MLAFLFFVSLIWVAFKLFTLSLRAAWGITKILFTAIFVPAIIVFLFLGGLIFLAIPILIILGIVAVVWMALRA